MLGSANGENEITGVEEKESMFAKSFNSRLLTSAITPIILKCLPSFKVLFSKMSRSSSEDGTLHLYEKR